MAVAIDESNVKVSFVLYRVCIYFGCFNVYSVIRSIYWNLWCARGNQRLSLRSIFWKKESWFQTAMRIFPRGNVGQISGNGLPRNLLFCMFLYFEIFGVYFVHRSIYWNLFHALHPNAIWSVGCFGGHWNIWRERVKWTKDRFRASGGISPQREETLFWRQNQRNAVYAVQWALWTDRCFNALAVWGCFTAGDAAPQREGCL